VGTTFHFLTHRDTRAIRRDRSGIGFSANGSEPNAASVLKGWRQFATGVVKLNQLTSKRLESAIKYLPECHMAIRWQHYPRSMPPLQLSREVIKVFEGHLAYISSSDHKHGSDQVLAILADDLRKIGFQIERGKKKDNQIAIPVLFGINGRVEKSFSADGYHPEQRYMLEVEAGRGVTNHQFLKDLFQACACDNVDSIGIALRNDYRGSDDFYRACAFIDAVFNSRRFQLPLREVLIIGY